MNYLYISLLFFTSTLVLSGQKEVELADIKIQENRLSIPFSETVRSLEILTRKEIKSLPVTSVQELLQYVGGVDLRRRGPSGVQADISFRGSTFEQVLVLLNGVKVIDPQTGHHVLNLPIDIDIIERIEIIKGPAGRIYGQGAFAGAINIVTKNPGTTKGYVEGTYGQNGLWGAKIGGNYQHKQLSTYLSIGHEQADPGFRRNNDFNRQNVFLQSAYSHKKANFLLNASYVRNGFGASSFYAAPGDSTSFEQVNTGFISLQSTIKKGKTRLTPAIYLRNNSDEYTYIRDNPSVFQNIHTSNVAGAMVNGSTIFKKKTGTIGYGVEYRNESLVSNNLGARSRHVLSANLEYKLYLLDDKLKFIPGASYNYYSDFGGNFLYGIDASVAITDELSLFGNAGTTYRIPSYTELYYEDRANIGNKNLQPETAINYEAGLKYISKKIVTQVSYFNRSGSNIIDWLQTPIMSADTFIYKWRPDNITKLPIQGLDVSTVINVSKFTFLSPLRKIRASYTFIDAKAIQNDLAPSRYALENIKHQVNVASYWSLLKFLKFNSGYRYIDRVEIDAYHVWDLGFGLNFDKIVFNMTMSNAFGTEYSEYPGIPMPSRWIRASARANF